KLGDVGEHGIARDTAVAQPARPGEACAGGRERLEAQVLQVARGADVPRIGNDEAAALVQAAKGGALFRGAGHGETSGMHDGWRKALPHPIAGTCAWLLTAGGGVAIDASATASPV